MPDLDEEPLAPHPAETAPTDGRVIRGYFTGSNGAVAEFIAVSWERAEGWVDVQGVPVAWRTPALKLAAWGDD